MAQVQFPSGPADGATYAVNNVTYTWSAANSLWTANNSTDLNSLFVAVAGDTMTGDLSINTTGALTLPVGTTAQQPSPTAAGQIRLNSDTGFYDVATDATTVRQLAYVAPDPTGLTSLTVTNGSTLPNTGIYNTITIPAGVTCYVEGSCALSAINDIIINGTVIGTDRGPIPGETLLYNDIAASHVLLVGGGLGVGPSPGGSSTEYTSGVGALGGAVASPRALSGTSGTAGGLVIKSTAAAPTAGLTNYGGTAAGGLFLRTKLGNITVGASASIQFDGGDAPVGLRYAGTAAVNTYGNGGGSGGTIVLQVDGAGTLDLNAGCSFSANGGAGSAPNSAGVTVGSGGGGGGGGYIIFNALTTTGSATTSVTGGAGGPALGNGNTFASAGGGNGGRGGNGGVSDAGTGIVTQAQAGDAGQVLSNVFLP